MRYGVAIAAALSLAACGPQGAAGDAGADADGDEADSTDTGPEPCGTEGALECTPDGYAIRSCTGGVWTITSDCMRESGRLCEDAACVEPWLYGSPAWDTCAGEPRATAESLAEKAATYDELAARLHIHPTLRWLAPVHLPSGATESTATFADVDVWHSGENDGLWSALYLAAQAYRYAVTHDAGSLATIRTLMDGEAARMRITGVPGVFTRQMIPPGVTGLVCPTTPSSYVPDVEKDDNRWVQVRDDGCVWVVDGSTMTWTATTHCGLDEFSGWCFLDNVSKDEYAGHLFALGAVWRLVDDEALRAGPRTC